MSFEELNDKYLTIGRNRRKHNNDSETRKGRKVIGKKGLGKLSVFGICRKIIVETTDRLGVTNSFSMDIDNILKANGGEYHPEIISLNKKEKGNKSGTKIILERVKRKTKFDLDEIKSQLSRKFSIFDVLETYIGLSNDLCQIKNEDKFDDLEVQFKWGFPTKYFGTDYENWNKIHGTLIATRKPLKDPKMKGVYLTSRGKIVNEAELYGRKDDRWFGTYFTGFLAVDFIDDYDKELISTNRCSLVWDEDETIELRNYLNHVLMKVEGEWNKKRNAENSAALKRDKGIDIDQFIGELPTYQQDLAQKIIYPIMDSPQIESEKSSKIISGVVDKFGNEDFRKMASDVVEAATKEDIPKFMNLLDEWKITEMHNMSALATSRVSIINNFEKMLDNDTKEVPTMHNFIKQFSWLLDPRLLELKDEVRYSQILKDHYPEEKLDEPDKRIDFLCSGIMSGILYVVEIKRSQYVVNVQALEQAYNYAGFIEDKFSTEGSFSRVVAYVIGGRKSTDKAFIKKAATYSKSNEVFVKTYTELLEQSKAYHQDFIEAASRGLSRKRI